MHASDAPMEREANTTMKKWIRHSCFVDLSFDFRPGKLRMGTRARKKKKKQRMSTPDFLKFGVQNMLQPFFYGF